MKILFLSQILPYPPNAGPRVKSWNVLRYLVSRGHEVHLACFVRPEEEEHLKAVKDLCASASAVRIERSRPADMMAWLRSHLSGRPFLVERDDVEAMTRLVRQLVESKSVEAIHADQLTMAQFALGARSSVAAAQLLVFDAHNAVWKIVERMKAHMPALMSPGLNLEARRVKIYEGMLVREFDRTLAVSKADRHALIEAADNNINGNGFVIAHGTLARRVSVMPIGVDTQNLLPVRRPDRSVNILMLGTLHYPPNADGVRWFVKETLPLIRETEPEVTLSIVGTDPPRDIRRLDEDPAIAVSGYAADLTPYLEDTAVLAVPVRAGGGMRVRILEGFARGLPMVTTTVGLEGIKAEPGHHILVADTAHEFAAAVLELLRNSRLRAQLAKRGRHLAEEKYDWRVALHPLNEIYTAERIGAHAV